MKEVSLALIAAAIVASADVPGFTPPEVMMADGIPIGTSGLYSSFAFCPTATDWDSDGDLDLLIGFFEKPNTAMGGGVSYFENIGTRFEPKLTERGYLTYHDGSPITFTGW